jgi:hypothetical protein
LPKNSVPATGIVIKHRYDRGAFYLVSEYLVIDSSGETQTFKQEHTCSEEQYHNFPDGSQIPLVYSPQNPKVSAILGDDGKLSMGGGLTDDMLKWTIIFMLVPILIIATIQSIRNHFASRKRNDA